MKIDIFFSCAQKGSKVRCVFSFFIYIKANQTKRKELNSISNKIYLLVTAPFFCLPTYIPRMLPALFMEKIQVSGKVNIFLQLIPYTAMASLIFPAILYIDKNIWIGIIASVVAVIAALKKLPVIGVVLVSVISCVILYMFTLS